MTPDPEAVKSTAALDKAIDERLCLDLTHTWGDSYCQSCDKRPPVLAYMVHRFLRLQSENEALKATAETAFTDARNYQERLQRVVDGSKQIQAENEELKLEVDEAIHNAAEFEMENFRMLTARSVEVADLLAKYVDADRRDAEAERKLAVAVEAVIVSANSYCPHFDNEQELPHAGTLSCEHDVAKRALFKLRSQKENTTKEG